MENTEKYTTVIRLNSEQAQKEISKLENKIENLKRGSQGWQFEVVE